MLLRKSSPHDPAYRIWTSYPLVLLYCILDINRSGLNHTQQYTWLLIRHVVTKRYQDKVNGSHHGDNTLLRPTGIQIATNSYATIQATTPTNIKMVHQTSLLHATRAASIDSDCCRLPTTSVLRNKPDKLGSNLF